MFWKIKVGEDGGVSSVAPPAWDGRFVMHRHCDGDGPHLDLRIEHEGCLGGWRIDATSLNEERWATEKAPHPLHWLEQDGEAVREDAGLYAWQERDGDGGVLLLQGRNGRVQRVEVRREAGLPCTVVGEIRAALDRIGLPVSEASRLIADGASARQRAVARLCGLGRELDGSAFEEGLCKKTLAGLTLDEIHAQLRAYEVRFDQKHPPQPVSRPERLDDGPEEGRASAAMAIAREA